MRLFKNICHFCHSKWSEYNPCSLLNLFAFFLLFWTYGHRNSGNRKMGKEAMWTKECQDGGRGRGGRPFSETWIHAWVPFYLQLCGAFLKLSDELSVSWSWCMLTDGMSNQVSLVLFKNFALFCILHAHRKEVMLYTAFVFQDSLSISSTGL